MSERSSGESNVDARLLAGDCVLVTGGSGGIGRGICEVAAREGAAVAFTWCENQPGADDTAARIAELGGHSLPIRADLREPDAPRSVVDRIESEWGRLDVVINNAAASEAIPFILIDDGELADLLALNVYAPFRLCRAAARGMIRRKYGRIVNISSITGSRSIPGPVHYAASKGALEAFTRSVAHELGPYGVLVNAIAAGVFEGGLRQTIPEHHQKRYVDACALSRIGQPTECGELAVWLASRRNTYTTGTVVFHDGGTLG